MLYSKVKLEVPLNRFLYSSKNNLHKLMFIWEKYMVALIASFADIIFTFREFTGNIFADLIIVIIVNC